MTLTLTQAQMSYWDKVTQELAQERERIQAIKSKIIVYVDEVLSKQYKHKIGLVHTKLEEDIKNSNRFMIWIDSYNVHHQFINIPPELLV